MSQRFRLKVKTERHAGVLYVSNQKQNKRISGISIVITESLAFQLLASWFDQKSHLLRYLHKPC